MKNVFLLLLPFTLSFCTEQSKYYTQDDFVKVDKIDVHTHITTNRDVFVEQARKDNFKLLNMAVDISNTQDEVIRRYNYCLDQKTRHPEDFEFATAFPIEGWDEPDWVANTLAWLDKSFNEGAIGVKVWKNIGMVFRDKNGELVMIDDPKLDTIFNYIEKRGKTLIGHLGEPKNCWLPLDEMTVNNDISYFKDHPEYHMYKHPDLPSYEEQIAARDRMLDKNPGLTFVGAHMGSLEWSVDELGKRFDKYPNMSVDVAGRVGQIFRQTQEDRQKVRRFFIKYQDRLLYGTDFQDRGTSDPADSQSGMHSAWLKEWRYFVTDDMLTSSLIDGEFQGLHLPREVIDKIYSKNARKWLKMFPEDRE